MNNKLFTTPHSLIILILFVITFKLFRMNTDIITLFMSIAPKNIFSFTVITGIEIYGALDDLWLNKDTDEIVVLDY